MDNNHLIATDGMLFTNGEVCVTELWLGYGDSADNWWEITKEEALSQQEEQMSDDIEIM